VLALTFCRKPNRSIDHTRTVIGRSGFKVHLWSAGQLDVSQDLPSPCTATPDGGERGCGAAMIILQHVMPLGRPTTGTCPPETFGSLNQLFKRKSMNGGAQLPQGRLRYLPEKSQQTVLHPQRTENSCTAASSACDLGCQSDVALIGRRIYPLVDSSFFTASR